MDKPQGNRRVSALIGLGQEFFDSGRHPDLFPVRAALHGEVSVFPLAVGLHIQRKAFFKVSGKFQFVQLFLQLPVNEVNHLSPGMLRLSDHTQGLLPAVIEIQILIEHTAVVQLGHLLRKQAHLRVLVDPGIGKKLLLDILSLQPGIPEPGKMVEPIAFHIQRAVGDLQELLQLLNKAAGSVTDAINVVKALLAHGLGNDTAGIREIKDQMTGLCQLFRQIAVINQRGNGADRHGKTTAAGSLLPQNPKLHTGPLVKEPALISAGTDGRDDIVHIRQGGCGITGHGKLQVRFQPCGNFPGDTAVGPQLPLVIIQKDDMIHPDAPGVFDQGFGQKRRPGAGTANYTKLHGETSFQANFAISAFRKSMVFFTYS